MHPPPGGGKLAANMMHFARVLRSAGLPVGPGQVLDALGAVAAVGIGRREDFYWALNAVFVTRRDQRELFDQAFHVFWRNPRLLERVMGLVLPQLRLARAAEAMEEVSRRLAEALAGADATGANFERSDIRGAVTQRVVEALGVNPAEVRLLFDHRDSLFLDTAGQGLQFEIQPLGNLTSDRIHLSVRTWKEGRVQETRFVSVRPMIRTDVAVLGVDIPRGREIKGENLLSEQRWLSLSLSESMIAIAQATGRKAARKLRAGQVISRRDLKHPMLIKRGDRVMVQCLVGGLVIRVEAEARSNAAEGEPVELRKLGQRDTFFAIASETGLATLDLTR